MEDSWIISKVLFFFFHKINLFLSRNNSLYPCSSSIEPLDPLWFFLKKNTIEVESVNMAYFEYPAWTNQHESATDLSTNQWVVQPHKENLLGVQVGYSWSSRWYMWQNLGTTTAYLQSIHVGIDTRPTLRILQTESNDRSINYLLVLLRHCNILWPKNSSNSKNERFRWQKYSKHSCSIYRVDKFFEACKKNWRGYTYELLFWIKHKGLLHAWRLSVWNAWISWSVCLKGARCWVRMKSCVYPQGIWVDGTMKRKKMMD